MLEAYEQRFVLRTQAEAEKDAGVGSGPYTIRVQLGRAGLGYSFSKRIERGHSMKLRSGLLAAVAGLAFAFPASAQTAEDFDEGRAWLPDEPMFDAFYPESYESLEDALDDRRVSDETPLLVLQREGTTLTLVTMQMSYHHIAQGDLAGEPWMVSF